MGKYKIWDRQETVWVPGVNPKTGESFFTPEEWIAENPWLKNPASKMIIHASELNGACALNFSLTKEQYRRMGAAITDDMTDGEVLAAIEEFEDNPPGADEPSDEERIAAALEAQVLLSEPMEEAAAACSLCAPAQDAAPSAAFQRVKRNYGRGLWNAALVRIAAAKGQLTEDEAQAILNG